MSNQPSVLQLFNESGYKLPFQQPTLDELLEIISRDEKVTFEMVELVYISEQEIIKINKEFLERDYITDIISFRYDDDETNSQIEGTLYCCAPRIKEQATEYGESEAQEFLRIFVHGLLHLIGYNDGTKEEKDTMTHLENKYLDQSAKN